MNSVAAVESELRATIEGEVRFDVGTRAAYATDASNYRQVPVGIVIPRHEGDVIAALSLARENSMPILARGGGTSLAGQACNAALVLDFSKYMNRVIAIDPDARVAQVEPGVIQSHLNAALAPHGLFFAPDPSTKDRCTVGGMIGNNSCGAHSAAYGKTVDNLEALEVILYDGTQLSLTGWIDDVELVAAIANGGREGEVYSRLRELRDQTADSVRAHFPKLPRRVSGYNLDELMPERGFNLARAIVGSEGTLATVLRATIRAVPRPNELALAVLGFDDVFTAADQMPWLLDHRPEALEGFDQNLPEFARIKAMPGVRFLPAGRAFLLVELGGASRDEARERAERVIAQARGLRECAGTAYLADAREQGAVWQIRESGLGSSAFIPGRPRSWPGAEDAAVPPANLGAFLRGFDRILSGHSLEVATYYGHFGEGCVHARVNFDLASAPGIKTFRAAMTELGALVANLGGSLSGEHGDGLARSELLPMMFRPELIDAFRDFKRIFDPDSKMNPGVIVDPHPLDSHLKLGANYRPREIATHFNFSAEGGLAGAALKCVGIGKCRKTEAGTMCPSYMATREEIHSTRGRARILFEALTTDLLPEGFADPAVQRCARSVPVVQRMQGRVPIVGGHGRVSRGVLLELLSKPSASALVGFLRQAERSRAARVVRSIDRQRAVACADCRRAGEKSARDSSGSRVATFRTTDFPLVVRAQDGSQSEHARGRPVSRHLHQLFRTTGRDRRGRSSRARRTSRDRSAQSVMLRPPALRPGDAGACEGAAPRRDGRARSIRRRRYPRRRAGA